MELAAVRENGFREAWGLPELAMKGGCNGEWLLDMFKNTAEPSYVL